MHTVRTFEQMIMKSAEEVVWLQESDSASANIRLFHFRLGRHFEDKSLREISLCQSHQVNLAETAVVGSTDSGRNLISALFSFTHFWQFGTHFSRLREAVHQHVEEVAEIIVTTSEPPVQQYTQELVDMQLQLRLSRKKEGGMPDFDTDPTSRSRFHKQMVKFKQMWNGDIAGTRCQHYCVRVGPRSSWCCKDDRESKAKLAAALCEAALTSAPDPLSAV